DPRLRVPGDRTAQQLRPGGRRRAPAGRQRHHRTLLHAQLGHRGIRGLGRCVQWHRFPRKHRRRARRALALAGGHGARRRRRADREPVLPRSAVAHRHRTRPVTRARKWLLGIVVAIVAIVIVLAASLSWVLYTPSGLRFALDRGVAMMHGQLAYASASGTLAGTTTIDGLRYHTGDGTKVAIDRASVDLRPWALLGHTLHIARARFDGITLDLAPSKPSSTSSGFSLKPPLAIVLDDTQLTHIVVDESGKRMFAADSLALAGRWSSRQLLVKQLTLRAPDGSANLDGTLAIASGYPGQGSAKFDWTYDGTRYTGTLASQSDGKTAQLHAALSAPVVLRADASVKLDAAHAWTLALNAPKFDTKALPALPASVKTLALDVHGSGDGGGGKLDGTLVVNDTPLLLDPAQFRYDGKTLTLDPLRLRSPQIAGIATASGVVHLD